jgi:hypothetical protein
MVALTFAGCHHDKKQADLSGETQAGEIYGRPAPGWQGMLRSHHGWLGAEGIYSVAMNSVEVPGKADCKTSGRFIPLRRSARPLRSVRILTSILTMPELTRIFRGRKND